MSVVSDSILESKPGCAFSLNLTLSLPIPSSLTPFIFSSLHVCSSSHTSLLSFLPSFSSSNVARLLLLLFLQVSSSSEEAFLSFLLLFICITREEAFSSLSPCSFPVHSLSSIRFIPWIPFPSIWDEKGNSASNLSKLFVTHKEVKSHLAIEWMIRRREREWHQQNRQKLRVHENKKDTVD